MTGTLLALGLVSMVLTFLLATIEESLWNVSRVRAEEMSDEGVRGSAALLRILDDRSEDGRPRQRRTDSRSSVTR